MKVRLIFKIKFDIITFAVRYVLQFINEAEDKWITIAHHNYCNKQNE